jgi:TRAP transporter TAXI family solute receptor
MLNFKKNWVFCLLAGLTIVAIPLVCMSELFAATPSATKPTAGTPAPVKPTPTLEIKAKPALPSILSMGSLVPGTASNAWATGLASAVAKNTSMKLVIESHPGPGVSFALMKDGKIELVGCPAAEMLWAYWGQYGYKQPTEGKGYKGLRMLFMDAEYVVGLVTGADTGLKKVSELRGKRIALVDEVLLSAYLSVRGAVANGGLTEKDVIFVPVSSASEGKKLNVERKVAASSHPLGAGDVEEISAARGGARFLSLDPSPEARARLNQFHPAIPKRIKAGAVTGVVEDTWLSSFRSGVASWETLPDAAAYAIVESIWNDIDAYRTVQVLLKALTRERLATVETTIPYHTGAIQFYKAKGLWTEELEHHQKALLGKR